MIEQLSPRLRDALARRAVPYAGGAATLLIVLLMGMDSISLHVTSGFGELLIPAALGAPTTLPALRFSPLGQQSGSTVVCEDFAALVMVIIVVAVLSRHVRTYPNSSRIHRLLTGWGSLVAAGAAAGFFQGLVVARLIAGGPLAYFGYPVSGAVFGVAWALALGWLPGAAAVLAVGSDPVRRALGRQWAAVGRPLVARGRASAATWIAARVAAGHAAAATRRAAQQAAAEAAAAASAAQAAQALGASPLTAATPAADAATSTTTASTPAAGPAAASVSAAGPSDGGAAAGSPVARGLEAGRVLLGRVGPPTVRLLRECRRLGTLALKRLYALGVRLADWSWLVWDRSLRRSKRVWARALREARLLRRIRPGDLRAVRSLGDLRALRDARGEKHEASRITTP
ncbi:hypothetical protein [Streptacidiphilus sp. P02-A3a]|uniref:hypothetical protein n=1 Tax=Streptacidiphilus sp. P02-A3a TaxID=2704468 RepID=UPI0015F831D4|nr:hypothetical protein [Streptacidiphilus sp. P02-A3a]QMU67662.1 hypothetical protein GXP74_04890 [Streptacidiphilus sp. P02-A3a]